MKKKISEILETSVLVLIGHKDQVLKRYSLKERDYRGQRFVDFDKNLDGFTDILSLTKPSVISEVDERFLKSGADIVVTNTAKANRYFLQEYGLENITYELNLESAKIARDKISKYSHLTRNKPRFFAGSISSMPDDLEFDYVKGVYSEQLKSLLAGKVDVIFLNAMNNEQSLKASLSGLNSILEKRKKDIEVLITIDNDELISWIENKDLTSEYNHVKIVAVGKTNQDYDFVEKLSKNSPFKIISIIDKKDELDEFYLEETKKMIENKIANIIMYDATILPQTIEKIIDSLD